jgi:hypothetical protein
MNPVLEALDAALGQELLERAPAEQQQLPRKTVGWNLEAFAEEQLRSLVRHVFFPGWSRSAKQVVFAAVDQHTDTQHTCLQVAGVLEAQIPGAICIVGAVVPASDGFKDYGGTAQDLPSVQENWKSLRKSSRQVSERTWALSMQEFLNGESGGRSAAWLHGRLEQLRLEFNYTLIQAPAAGFSSEAALLGNLCDGVILLLEARYTRRAAAHKAKAMLHAANARLLGTILTERTFPIPEGIYRRL